MIPIIISSCVLGAAITILARMESISCRLQKIEDWRAMCDPPPRPKPLRCDNGLAPGDKVKHVVTGLPGVVTRIISANCVIVATGHRTGEFSEFSVFEWEKRDS